MSGLPKPSVDYLDFEKYGNFDDLESNVITNNEKKVDIKVL